MGKNLLCAILALTFVGSGIVRADEPPDQWAVEGGAERVVVPLKEIQGLQVGFASRHSTKRRIIVIAAIVGAVVTLLALGMFRPMP